MCTDVHQTTFIMSNHPKTLPHLLRSLALACATLFILPESHAQEWGLESRCGKFRNRPCIQGAVELTAGPLMVQQNGGHATVPQASLAIFGRQSGPFKRGVRVGLAHLGSEVQDQIGEGTSTRYRQAMPELAGLLRFEPFRGGFRPFVEGEVGFAASVMDERSFDAEGNRTAHRFSGFDPGLNYGWSAGARLRMGSAAFLMVRYGSRLGSSLNLPGIGQEEATSVALDREDVSVGFSFAF